MRVLVIPDLHSPAIEPRSLDFVKSVQDYYQTDRVVFVGDIVDSHQLSFHESEPSAPSAVDEYEQAMAQLEPWFKHFPKADFLIGNHDAIVHRRAFSAGLPERFIKDIATLLCLPKKWKVTPRYGATQIDDVLYFHGEVGPQGQGIPAHRHALQQMQSVVQGHLHQSAGVIYSRTSRGKQIFGMQVGSLCDPDAINFSYSKKYAKGSPLGCGVVLDGEMAIFEAMPS